MSHSIHDAPAASPGRYRWLTTTIRAFNANKTSWLGLAVFLIVLLLAILAPWISPHDPVEQDVFSKLKAPFDTYYLGTDYFGRDILSRLLYGARISLVIGIASTAIALVIGSAIGIIAGWYGGRLDIIVMQMMDMLLAFPSLILGLILVAMLGPSVTNIVIAIAITSIPSFARIARAPTIAIKEREFIDAGRSLGFSDARLMLRHVLPNIFPEILVMGSLWLASAIRTEASLAFVGLGVKPPIPTWGGMIREGFENILDSYWLVLAPSIAILLVVFALNILGDGLRDAIDPKLKGER
ncbi:MAG: ABC transporter permease [Methylobacterium sp.]|jgi:peptide/nickel transport system permease protein|nr:ABC transporter permease [Methylobacterium sp.]MCA3604441.1 ABC transporter permease [Methylobacterium sp.]MCA3616065.1 ABC transporter permease [Methylobacterium sp.]MCA3628154.1 ABC transporter permease [Methylobacterium sp.]MCA4911262.1 ABC transporter permease [Methylobacterium sp.]